MADNAYQPLVEEENGQPAGIIVDQEEKKDVIVTADSSDSQQQQHQQQQPFGQSTAIQNMNQSGNYHSLAASGAGPMRATVATDAASILSNDNDSEASSAESVWDEDDYDVLNNIISRNYALLFFLTVFGTFIGMIIYVVTDKPDYIWLGGCIAFAIAFVIDISMPHKPFKIYYKDDLILGEPKIQKWTPPSKGCNFYVQCDFTDYEDRYTGSTAIYELDEPDATEKQLETKTDTIDTDFNNNNNLNGDRKTDENDAQTETTDDIGNPMVDNGLKIYNRNKMDGTNILNFFGGYDDSRILIFRQRSVFRLDNYKGYEVGGGFAGLAGFVISCVIGIGEIADKLDPGLSINTARLISEIVTWIIFIVFVTFVLFLIGCLCELELRKNDFLAPLGMTYESSEWIPLSEIIGWYYNSVGFDYKKEKEKENNNICHKFAMAWFEIIMGSTVFVAKLIKKLVEIIIFNAAFALWLIVTLAMAFAYWPYMNKDEEPLIGCIIFCILGVLANAVCLWFVSNNSHAGCCGEHSSSYIGRNRKYRMKKLSNRRINYETQNKFYNLFLISLICLSVACAAALAMIVEILISKGKHHKFSSWNSSHWKYITCQVKSVNDNDASDPSSSNITDISGISSLNAFDALGYTPSGEEVDLCTVYVYAEHVGVLVSLSLAWFILWIAAFWWYLVDNSMTIKRVSKPDTYRWKEYTLFTVKRRSAGVMRGQGGSGADNRRGWTRFMPSMSTLKRMVGGNNVSEYTFKLDLDTSLKLYYYLARATKMYRRRNAILSNPWPTPIYNMPQCEEHPLHEPHHCTCVAKLHGNQASCHCTHCKHSEYLKSSKNEDVVTTEKDRNMKKDD